ncbi:MAG: LamG domain-containing protein [Phycisphaerales bacterium]|nr:LamG domain-containing protein [Phycisphaerales bacterium]
MFNGSTSRIETNYAPSLGPDDSMTISAWVRATTLSATIAGDIVGLERASSTEIRLLVRGDTGQAHASFRSDNNGQAVVISPQAVVDGQWHHLASVRDGVSDEVRLYVDGRLAGYVASANANINVSNPLSLAIGADNHATHGLQDFFPGEIDELRIYQRALTFAEIRSLAGRPCIDGDVNYNGSVDLSDLNDILFNFGQVCP